MLHWCHTLKVLKQRSSVSQNAWDVKTGITTRKNCCLSFLSDQNSWVQTSNVWKMPPKRPIVVWVAYHFLMTSGRLRLPTPQQQPVAGGVFSSLAMLIVSGETRTNSWELLYPKCRFRMIFVDMDVIMSLYFRTSNFPKRNPQLEDNFPDLKT